MDSESIDRESEPLLARDTTSDVTLSVPGKYLHICERPTDYTIILFVAVTAISLNYLNAKCQLIAARYLAIRVIVVFNLSLAGSPFDISTIKTSAVSG